MGRRWVLCKLSSAYMLKIRSKFVLFTNVRRVALLKLLCSVCFLELFLVRGGSQDQTVTRHTDGLTPSMSFRVLNWTLFEALLWLLCGQILFRCTWCICALLHALGVYFFQMFIAAGIFKWTLSLPLLPFVFDKRSLARLWNFSTESHWVQYEWCMVWLQLEQDYDEFCLP